MDGRTDRCFMVRKLAARHTSAQRTVALISWSSCQSAGVSTDRSKTHESSLAISTNAFLYTSVNTRPTVLGGRERGRGVDGRGERHGRVRVIVLGLVPVSCVSNPHLRLSTTVSLIQWVYCIKTTLAFSRQIRRIKIQQKYSPPRAIWAYREGLITVSVAFSYTSVEASRSRAHGHDVAKDYMTFLFDVGTKKGDKLIFFCFRTFSFPWTWKISLTVKGVFD